MAVGYWEQREELEAVPEDRSAREAWADGRDRYVTVCWSLEGEIADELAAVADRLDECDCLRGVPARYLHVTVKELGFVVPDPVEANELSAADLERIENRTAEIASDVDPFEVRFPRLDLFPTVVFAAVDDGGRFERIHRRLRSIDGVPTYRYDGIDYAPHVTLAKFVDADLDPAIERLEGDRELAIGPATVDALDLIAVDPTAFAPRFETVRRIEL